MALALYHIPRVRPKPDANRFIEVLMGRAEEGHVPLVEYLVDDLVRRPIVTDLLGRTWVEPEDRAS
jgi:hypothetical protein